MRINVNGELKEFRTIWREGNLVKLIDQRLLPYNFEILTLKTHFETAEAIRDMAVRGAGAIGIAGGYGVAQAALEASEMKLDNFMIYLDNAAKLLCSTRPTAVNLYHVINRCLKAATGRTVEERTISICLESDNISKEDLEASLNIGKYGVKLIKDGHKILTHCNAGALAFIDHGTALSPIRTAHREGKHIFVFVDETRPRMQGAKLTAWELQQEGIPYSLISDNAAGYYMQRQEVDMVIVGADRIAANGDTANKIGTYEKAVLAKENNIPFYVAAPRLTFDLECRTGKDIEIEERSADEINWIWGVDDHGEYKRVRISAENTTALNPSFDVTPAKYITGFVTENGLIKPPFQENIRTLFN